MANWRNYPASTRAALAALAQGTCYFPGCDVPILVFVGKTPELNVEIAHIRALKPDGPRHVKGMSDDELNSFENLILLCIPHHKTVDKTDPDSYSIVLLESWKAKRESSGQTALKGLSGITEDRLQEMISGSLESVNQQISDALARFERTDSEAARLIRLLMDQLTDPGRRYGVDPDTAAMLATAARDLGPLQDVAPILAEAADDLKTLQDTAGMLVRAADSLKNLEDTAGTLMRAAGEIRRSQGYM